MSFIGLLVFLLVVGIVLFFGKKAGLDERIVTVIVVLVILGVILWVLDKTDLWDGAGNFFR